MYNVFINIVFIVIVIKYRNHKYLTVECKGFRENGNNSQKLVRKIYICKSNCTWRCNSWKINGNINMQIMWLWTLLICKCVFVTVLHLTLVVLNLQSFHQVAIPSYQIAMHYYSYCDQEKKIRTECFPVGPKLKWHIYS